MIKRFISLSVKNKSEALVQLYISNYHTVALFICNYFCRENFTSRYFRTFFLEASVT